MCCDWIEPPKKKLMGYSRWHEGRSTAHIFLFSPSYWKILCNTFFSYTNIEFSSLDELWFHVSLVCSSFPRPPIYVTNNFLIYLRVVIRSTQLFIDSFQLAIVVNINFSTSRMLREKLVGLERTFQNSWYLLDHFKAENLAWEMFTLGRLILIPSALQCRGQHCYCMK